MGRRIRDAFRVLVEHLHLLSWVTQVVKRFRLYLAGIIALNVVQMLMGVFFSVYVKDLIDSKELVEDVTNRFILYAILLTAWSIAWGFLDYITSMYYVKITFSVRKKVYEAVLKAQMLKMSSLSVGDLNTRISGDSAEVANFACETFPALVGAVLQLIFAAFIVFFVNRQILLILLAGGLISAVTMLFMRLRMQPLQEDLRQASVDESSFQTELCTNLRLVKGLCREDAQSAKLERLHFNKVDALRRKNRFSYTTGTAMDVFFNAGYLLVFGWSLMNLHKGAVTYGTLSMLIALEGYIQGPVSRFASALPTFVRTLVSAGKLDEVMQFGEDEESEAAEPPDGDAFRIVARNLSYAYPTRETPVFTDFHCDILPGEIAVIVGPSGGGKTTLLHLLMHLLTPQTGSIEFIAPSGEKLPASRSVRRRMGYVPQGNTLFSGTILENVCFGVDQADEEQAREALRLADALEFVEAMPKGIHSRIGERNAGLSAGQAQRISIARALMMHPAVLILDEATSALDHESEKRILTSIAEVPHHPTVLCVTHRHAALKYADQIIRVTPDGFEYSR
ncbi:MAG: ABC transporter ATP-binding protein [Clostridia bacterium]|nr:ABC transporter ATP-binding protein [Clostridia bacterium]